MENRMATADGWEPIDGETRRWGAGMVEMMLAVGKDEVVCVIAHESVKEKALKTLYKKLKKKYEPTTN